MSGNSLQLSKKIGVAGDLGGVVRSMKALAASSLGQYERAVESLNSYVEAVDIGLGACLRQDAVREAQTPLGKHPERAIVIAFGSDQGLVGSFNETLAATLATSLAELNCADIAVWAIGERLVGVLRSDPKLNVTALDAPSSIGAVGNVVDRLLTGIAKARERDTNLIVRIVHHHPEQGASYQPVLTRLLPFDAGWRERASAVAWPTKLEPEMINGSDVVLAELIDAYLFVMLFRACVESLASENASRLAAMQRAEKNIDGLLEEMGRSFHRIRQETIDDELFDVIAGFDAVQSSSRAAPSVVTTQADQSHFQPHP